MLWFTTALSVVLIEERKQGAGSPQARAFCPALAKAVNLIVRRPTT